MHEIGHFIGGKEVKGTSGRYGDVFNPNTGEVQARVALAKHAGWVTFYGPNFVRFTRRKDDYPLTPVTEEWFQRALQPEPLGRVFEDPENPYVLTVGGGSAEAPLVGGCLTLLASSIGTPYEFQADGCVLMVEDLNTEPYLVRRGSSTTSRASCSAPT